MVERPTLSVASRQYAEFSVARGLEPGTVNGRLGAVKALMSVTGDIQVESVTPKHIERVFTSFNWAPTTANNRLSQYRTFFNWCRARRFISRDNDPVLGWRMRAVPEAERTRVPVQEWPKLIQACQTPHERFVIATGLYLFLRVGEIAGLQVKSLDFQNHLIDVYRPKPKKWDTMPISAELAPLLREHLEWMSSQGFNDPEHYLMPSVTKTFTSHEGRFTKDSWRPEYDPTKPATHLHRFTQRVLDRAGLAYKKGEGGHLLRRSGARAYFDSLAGTGYDGALRRVQSMLGHKNSLMTEIYLGLDLDRATRNADLAGKPMFPNLMGENVTVLRRADGLRP